MRRLIVLVLFVSVIGTMWTRPAAAQGVVGRDLVAAGAIYMVKTDGVLAVWIADGGNLVAADLATGQVTSLDSNNFIASNNVAVSSGRVVWTHYGELRVYTAATGKTSVLPLPEGFRLFDLHGDLLVWNIETGAMPNVTETIWARNIAVMGPDIKVSSTTGTIYGVDTLQTNGTSVVWSQGFALAHHRVCYELYAVALDGSAPPSKQAEGSCDIYVNSFTLSNSSIFYLGNPGILYRHPLNGSPTAITDPSFDGWNELQAGGNDTYIVGKSHQQPADDNPTQQIWVYDLRTSSRWTVAEYASSTSDYINIDIGGDAVVWSDNSGSQPMIHIRPIAAITPAAPRAASDPLVQNRTYYAESAHSLGGRFEQYWGKNGGLPVFGFPLTEELRQQNADTGLTYAVQYLERQRYEYHPELAGSAYEILLGRLGAELLAQQGRNWRNEGADQPGVQQLPGTCQTFEATNRTVCGAFRDYWRGHGLDLGQAGTTADEALALFGYPLTEPRLERNADGDTVLTQWFERARFEWHPNNPAPYQVLLGRLAAEQLPQFDW
jgi:hypothetical protein